MRRTAIAILAAALVAFALAHADDALRGPPVMPKKTLPAGFDHAGHAKATTVACTQCHPLDRGAIAKAPTHATCFTAACHTDQTALLKLREAVPADRVKYCNACHAETALGVPLDKKALAATAATTGVDHAVQLGHDAHSQVACTRCHEPGRARRGRPHERCTTCHAERGGSFPISECAKCHPPGTDRPRLARSEVVVTSAFSHARHATRGAGKQCVTCHAAIESTDARALPAPKVESCSVAGCHDGKAAFDAIAACRRCHLDPPKREFEVERPDKLYSHATHDPHVKQACGACHPLSKGGEVRAAGHQACVEGCHQHAAEFGLREPTICGACHDGTEPWRALIADKLPSDATEFGATLDHDKHTATVCAGCHSLTTSRTELRPPRGHRSCTSAGCHAVTGGPAPQMTACESCHQRNVAAARESARRTARWSVRATFDHRNHATKVITECVRCHTDLSSPTLLSLPAPTKASCAGCHDGRQAFKVTGTSCKRCHPGTQVEGAR